MSSGKAYTVMYRSVAGVVWNPSTSNDTRSPIARAEPESAANGVGEVATVVASVGLVVNIVVPFLLTSTVVEPVTPAVPESMSQDRIRYS